MEEVTEEDAFELWTSLSERSRNNPNQGYKSQYQQGPKQNQSYHPQNTKGFQGQGQVMQQPHIDCGIVLPSNFALEQFVEISKALKKIEDKYTHPHLKPQQQYEVQRS